MDVGDKIVCIKPYFLEKTELNYFITEAIDIKIGDIYTILKIENYIGNYTGEGLRARREVFIVSDGKTKLAFYSRELSYRNCIYDHFITLAKWREKQIDSILYGDED